MLRRSHIARWMPHIMWMPADRSGIWGYTPRATRSWAWQMILYGGRFRGHVVQEQPVP